MNSEEKIAYLGMIQAVISRMANNSFLLKGWTITLVAAIFALAAKDARLAFLVIGFLPSASFWGLDAYFLRQERLFRKIYEAAARNHTALVDFSMDTRPCNDKVPSFCETFWSKTLVWFYLPILILLVLLCFGLVFLNKGGVTPPPP